ncbi:MAG: CDP-diacylglycerol--glycerol-3-phosphate 3-phosphatidyltransferase [Thermodesulfobacteriota bacterium]
MNIPNSLTILRILFVPLLIILVIDNHSETALIVFIAAAITDGLDGFIARMYDQKTVLGSYLDPAADKLLLVSCYIALTIKGYLPSWLAVIVVSRDIILITGFMVIFLLNDRKSVEISPTFISKITTFFQIVVILGVLLTMNNILHSIYILYWITALLTIISGLDYIYKGSRRL